MQNRSRTASRVAATRAASFGPALALDPPHAARHRWQDDIEQLAVARQAPVFGQGEEGGTIGVPLLALAEEEAVAVLARRVRRQHLGRFPAEAETVEGG